MLVPHESLGATLPPRGSPAAAKLTDFGGARLAGDDALTRTGDVLGTLAYMAPEQSDGGDVGEAADLYSLALILYEAFSGVNPVRGPTTAATARRIGRPLESLRGPRGDLPLPLTRALDRALSPRPEERGTVAELRMVLADALADVGERHSAPALAFGRVRRDAAAWDPEGERPPCGSSQREPDPGVLVAPAGAPPRALRAVGPARRQPRPAAAFAALASAPAWEAAPAPPRATRSRRAPRARSWAVATRPQESIAALAPGAQPLPPLSGDARAEPRRARQATRSRHAPASLPEPAGAEVAASGRARRLALVRTVWIGCATAAIVWQAWIGRAGLALLLLAALVPVFALSSQRTRRARQAGDGGIEGGSLIAGALAPILGVAGLAGAFPALAGQASGWRTRAALGALGYWWLTLSEPLLAGRLWLGPPSGTGPRAAWETSLSGAAVHVLGPMLSLGVLLGASLWGAGALCLPWIVRGRRAALDIVAVTSWSAALAVAAPLLDRGLSSSSAHASPRGAVLGAVLGAVFVVAVRALRGPV